MLIWGIIVSLPRVFRDRKLILDQMGHIGVGSIPLVIIIGFLPEQYRMAGSLSIPGIYFTILSWFAVTKAIFIELGPVLTAIVLAGRIGASIAAELGTMKVTEQIDALESLAINPVSILYAQIFGKYSDASGPYNYS